MSGISLTNETVNSGNEPQCVACYRDTSCARLGVGCGLCCKISVYLPLTWCFLPLGSGYVNLGEACENPSRSSLCALLRPISLELATTPIWSHFCRLIGWQPNNVDFYFSCLFLSVETNTNQWQLLYNTTTYNNKKKHSTSFKAKDI